MPRQTKKSHEERCIDKARKTGSGDDDLPRTSNGLRRAPEPPPERRLVVGAGPSEEPSRSGGPQLPHADTMPPEVYDEEMLEHSIGLAVDEPPRAVSRGKKRGVGKYG